LSLRSVCLAGTVLLSLVARIHAQSETLETAGLPDEGRYLNKVLPDILVQSEQTPHLRLSDFWRDKPVLVTWFLPVARESVLRFCVL
jgi:hypothetical protein